jgi:RNase P protein component
LKEAFLLIQNQVSSAVDLVIIGTESTQFLPLQKIGEEIVYLLQKAKKRGYI